MPLSSEDIADFEQKLSFAEGLNVALAPRDLARALVVKEVPLFTDSTLDVFDVKPAAHKTSIGLARFPLATRIAINPDGSRLAWEQQVVVDGAAPSLFVVFLDLATGQEVGRRKVFSVGSGRFFLLPDGHTIVTDYFGTGIVAVDETSDSLKTLMSRPTSSLNALALSPDGGRLLVHEQAFTPQGPAHALVLLDLEQGSELWHLDNLFPLAAAFSPDGSKIFTTRPKLEAGQAPSTESVLLAAADGGIVKSFTPPPIGGQPVVGCLLSQRRPAPVMRPCFRPGQ